MSDANGIFGGAVEMIRFMHLSAHLPYLLVVGIGYRLGDIAETQVPRTRDFTPTYDAEYARILPQYTMMDGAPAFLALTGSGRCGRRIPGATVRQHDRAAARTAMCA